MFNRDITKYYRKTKLPTSTELNHSFYTAWNWFGVCVCELVLYKHDIVRLDNHDNHYVTPIYPSRNLNDSQNTQPLSLCRFYRTHKRSLTKRNGTIAKREIKLIIKPIYALL